jgi:hypothetical protein
VVSTQDLSIKAPGWKLSGNGTLVDLKRDSINFNLLVEVDEATVTSSETEYDLGGYSLPIACTGGISRPRCLPDAQQIIAAAVGNALQQRLGEFLQDRQGATRQTETAPADGTTPADEAQPVAPEAPLDEEQEEQDPAEQLLNRALDRFLRN